jgi:Ca2+-binding EF-hand superfamily protein
MKDRNKLNLKLDEIRNIPLPKLNYVQNSVVNTKKISPEHEEEIKGFFDSISNNGKIDPQELRHCLRRVDFHLEHSDIYGLIDELCVAQEKRRNKIDFKTLLDHLNENLANPKTMEGTNKIFELMVDPKNVIKEIYFN